MQWDFHPPHWNHSYQSPSDLTMPKSHPDTLALNWYADNSHIYIYNPIPFLRLELIYPVVYSTSYLGVYCVCQRQHVQNASPDFFPHGFSPPVGFSTSGIGNSSHLVGWKLKVLIGSCLPLTTLIQWAGKPSRLYVENTVSIQSCLGTLAAALSKLPSLSVDNFSGFLTLVPTAFFAPPEYFQHKRERHLKTQVRSCHFLLNFVMTLFLSKLQSPCRAPGGWPFPSTLLHLFLYYPSLALLRPHRLLCCSPHPRQTCSCLRFFVFGLPSAEIFPWELVNSLTSFKLLL